MEALELVLIILMIAGALVSLIIALPMKRHLLSQKKVKRILFFQMPFYLKDYYKMVSDTEDLFLRRKFRTFYIIFMTGYLGFILSAIIWLFVSDTL